ncbi:MAG: hypothetical protein WD048_02500 [Chitinophagales bacterium]
MGKVIFIGKNTAGSQTIVELAAQIENIQLTSIWIRQNTFTDIEIPETNLCILNLSDWDSGNMKILKFISARLPKTIPLLVIGTYKDPQLIEKILASGATAYVEQQKVYHTIEQKIRELLAQN